MVKAEQFNRKNFIVLGYRGAKGEPGPKGLYKHWVKCLPLLMQFYLIGEPGRSIPGSPGIDGFPGPSGLAGAKGKWFVLSMTHVDRSIHSRWTRSTWSSWFTWQFNCSFWSTRSTRTYVFFFLYIEININVDCFLAVGPPGSPGAPGFQGIAGMKGAKGDRGTFNFRYFIIYKIDVLSFRSWWCLWCSWRFERQQGRTRPSRRSW